MPLRSSFRCLVLPSLRLQIVDEGAATVAFVAGDVDADSAPELVAAVQQLAGDRPVRLVLDLAGVTFFGAAGLHALLDAQRLVTAASGRLVLRDPSPMTCRVLDALNAWKPFTVHIST
jgi:anti-anti-sigma factor